MVRRTALDIKKRILDLLKQKERTIRELETKVNTNHETILTQLKELEFFGLIKIIEHTKHNINGKPFRSVRLKS